MKVKSLRMALESVPDDAEIIMPDSLPVVSAIYDHGFVVLSDEIPQPATPDKKPITSTAMVKFALRGDLNPQRFNEWLQTEIEMGNSLIDEHAVDIIWSDVDFNPNLADEFAVHAARKLLDYSFNEINFDYDFLTAGEKARVTRAEFDNLVKQFKLER